MSEQKPNAGKAFEDLLGKLVQVPPKEAKRKARAIRKARAKRKKK